jgi:hypothetical protein
MDKNEQDEIRLSRWSAQQMLERLTPDFNLIASFVASPYAAIAHAAEERRSVYFKNRRWPQSGIIERYRARVSLELNIKTCSNVMRDFCTARVLAMDFQATNVAEDKIFLARILEIGKATQNCADYLANSLNVIKGTEKKLRHPDGPPIEKIDI